MYITISFLTVFIVAAFFIAGAILDTSYKAELHHKKDKFPHLFKP